MSAFRVLRSLTASSSRAVSARTFARSIHVPRLGSQLAPRAAVPASRWFSASAQVMGDGSTDLALSQKLAEELKYEQEASTEAGEPEFLTAFKGRGVWEVENVEGSDEVALTRKFGNESIRVVFSISDLQTDIEAEEFDGAEGEEGEVDAPHSSPVRCSISITKDAGVGALTFDAMAQEGLFVIENISFYPDGKLGTEMTAEADWKRRGLYIGPQFETLDVGVQEEFIRFLQERGINDDLALFIPELIEHKEQKEYVKWLGKVKGFVDV
ncbi:mitochondrial glycoprotein [Thelephora ganbajun]|uniref:Mitochondrial glycoprotein n=1 Tax=Thelephora ganbajun TaxID=370292 RepID=A0ACB6ZTV8_THEGA|nr:mitochondrial glycoprotein [Thelephora ganbajun]